MFGGVRIVVCELVFRIFSSLVVGSCYGKIVGDV